MAELKLNLEQLKKRIPRMSVGQLRSLVKDIYDERKHNRSMSEKDRKALKELETQVDKQLEEQKGLSSNDRKDYAAWKKKMEQGKRCY